MDYQDFFNHISQIANEYETRRREAIALGNNFNLFEVLRIQQDELIHSAIIADLLDIYGTHGRKDLFLRLFLSRLGKMVKLDTSTVRVEVEHVISDISKDKSRGGRIDILLTDSKGNAIIIENKINAADQEKQLLRYDNFGKDRRWNYNIIYLTLDGKDASEKSTGRKKIDYLRLSYKKDILGWLEECLTECPQGSLLYNNLKQYIDLLRNLFDMMDKADEAKLVELARIPDNAKAFISLLANKDVIAKSIIDRFIARIKDDALNFGFTVDEDEGFAERPETYLSFYIPKVSQNWKLWLGSDKSNASDTYFEIAPIEDHNPIIKKQDYVRIPLLWDNFNQAKSHPCGGDYLWSESGKKGSGFWYDWYSPDALAAMENGTMEHFIVNYVFQPVIEKKVFQILRTK